MDSFPEVEPPNIDMQAVSSDPLAFGMNSLDFSNLMYLFNEVIAASIFLSHENITMFEQDPFEPSDETKLEFLMFFSVSPPTGFRKYERFFVQQPTFLASNEHLELKPLGFFAMRLLTSLEESKQLLRPRRFGNGQRGGVPNSVKVTHWIRLREWDIISDVSMLKEMFPESEPTWKRCASKTP